MNSGQTEKPYTQTRVYRNFSNIKFTDQDPRNNKEIYPSESCRTYSQIGNLLSDENSKQGQDNGKKLKKLNQYIFKDRLAQNQHLRVYKVPEKQDVQFQRINKNYVKEITKKKKFVKPYSECTKYVDNLMKNKELLRRGQFDLPVENATISNYMSKSRAQSSNRNPLKTHNTQFIRSKIYRKQQHQSIDALKKKMAQTSDQKNGFDKTINNHYNSYREMLEVERNEKRQQINLKNSMNRVLAAEMIHFRLSNNDPNNMLKTRSMRLDKTH